MKKPMTLETNYNHLRLKVAIRKAMLSARDHEYPRRSLLLRFRWASQELFDETVSDLIREGTITEKTSSRHKVPVLVWNEQEGQPCHQ